MVSVTLSGGYCTPTQIEFSSSLLVPRIRTILILKLIQPVAQTSWNCKQLADIPHPGAKVSLTCEIWTTQGYLLPSGMWRRLVSQTGRPSNVSEEHVATFFRVNCVLHSYETCSFTGAYQRFEGICYHHLHGRISCGFWVIMSARWQPTFLRNTLPPSSR
jgi:hypothetical protein